MSYVVRSVRVQAVYVFSPEYGRRTAKQCDAYVGCTLDLLRSASRES